MLADGGLTPGRGLSQDSWCDLGGWDLFPHSLASFRRPAWAYPPGGACRIPSSRKGISKHLVMSADAPKPSFRVQRNRLSVAEPHREGHMWSKGYRPCHAPLLSLDPFAAVAQNAPTFSVTPVHTCCWHMLLPCQEGLSHSFTWAAPCILQNSAQGTPPLGSLP